MSKAFTRESDDDGDLPEFELPPALPAGATNYLTPAGARRLTDELEKLTAIERERNARAAGEGVENRRLEQLGRRIRHLRQSLQSAVVVPPPDASEDRVRFGATVRIREQDGTEAGYRIVGVDETDIDRDWVSWISPIARALMNARVGDRIRLKLPGGGREMEIIGISYERD